jgi:hypothetical protein
MRVPNPARAPRNGTTAARRMACLTMPCILALIPVVGMIWVSAPELAPPATSVARIVAVLAATTSLFQLLLRWRPAVVRANMIGLALLLMGLYPAFRVAASSVGLQETWAAGLYLPLCLLSGWSAGRLSADATVMLSDILLTVTGVLVVFMSALVYRVYVRPAPYQLSVQRAIERLSSPLPLPSSVDWRPDVYDLVLDGMGRPDVLERDYRISLRSQIDEFRAMGFAISANGHANYVQTQLSLASMLNVGYLDELASAEGTGREHGPLRDLISKARVPALFKRLGYRVEFLGSGYLSSGAFEQADVCDCPQLWFADAEVGALSLSPLKLFSGGIGSRAHYDRCMTVFDQFERTRTDPAPRFVFAHVPMPHPPFVADERGEYTRSSKPLSGGDGSFYLGSADEYKTGYRAQATFALTRTARAVRRIMDDAARHHRDVIVIVHGDHGPRLGFDALNPKAGSGQSALPILLAIRWPEGHGPVVDPESLVNVYRALFGHVFHIDVPLLPNRSYISPFDRPYVTIPVPSETLRETVNDVPTPSAPAASYHSASSGLK